MRRAQVLALSSMVEALSSVLIEALGMNLPIVATDCPTSPREILCDGLYGKLVPVGDPEAMAHALCGVLRRGGRPAHPPEALSRFQEDRVVEQYLQLVNCGAAEFSAALPSMSGGYSYIKTRHDLER